MKNQHYQLKQSDRHIIKVISPGNASLMALLLQFFFFTKNCTRPKHSRDEYNTVEKIAVFSLCNERILSHL